MHGGALRVEAVEVKVEMCRVRGARCWACPGRGWGFEPLTPPSRLHKVQPFARCEVGFCPHRRAAVTVIYEDS